MPLLAAIGRPCLSDKFSSVVHVFGFINQRILSDPQYLESSFCTAVIRSTVPMLLLPVLALPSLPDEPAAVTSGAPSVCSVGIKPNGFVVPVPVTKSLPMPRASLSMANFLNSCGTVSSLQSWKDSIDTRKKGEP